MLTMESHLLQSKLLGSPCFLAFIPQININYISYSIFFCVCAHMCIHGTEINISVFLYCCPPSCLRKRLARLAHEWTLAFGAHLSKPSTVVIGVWKPLLPESMWVCHYSQNLCGCWWSEYLDSGPYSCMATFHQLSL